jgi:hypothetical protein
MQLLRRPWKLIYNWSWTYSWVLAPWRSEQCCCSFGGTCFSHLQGRLRVWRSIKGVPPKHQECCPFPYGASAQEPAQPQARIAVGVSTVAMGEPWRSDERLVLAGPPSRANFRLQNDMKWLAFQIHIPEVPGSNIGPDTCNTALGYPWFPPFSPYNWDWTLNWSTISNLRFFPS